MKEDTKITSVGRDPSKQYGAVNPPVVHASTIVFPDSKALSQYATAKVQYGRHGTPGTFPFEEAIAELEGGFKTALTPSGLSACTIAILAFVGAGLLLYAN